MNRLTFKFLIALFLLSLLSFWLVLGGCQPGTKPAQLTGDSLDLIPLLQQAGGSPELNVSDPAEVAAIRFDTPDNVQYLEPTRSVDNIRFEDKALRYEITDIGNHITWPCDIDANQITHIELEGLVVEHGVGPTHVAWQGPNDDPETWHNLIFTILNSLEPHNCLIALEDKDAWKGKVSRMALTFCMPALRQNNQPAPVKIEAIRYLRMDLGTRLSMEKKPLSVHRVVIQNESRRVVHAPAPSAFPLIVEIPEGAWLDFAIGVYPSNYNKPGDRVTFSIQFTEEGLDTTETLYTRTLQVRTNEADRYWFDESVDLTALAGKTGILCFETTKDNPNSAGDALWAHPVLHGTKDTQGPPNVVWVVLDTVRADHLGCYGYERDTSPNLDTFARQSVFFEQAISQAPETVASQMSFLTSLYPSVHGISHAAENKALHEEVPTLAGVLRTHEQPFVTAAFTEGGSMTYRIGFDHGFDRYHDGGFLTERPGKIIEKTFGNGMDWLECNKDRRFFLFLHTYEPHSPYNPPPPYDNMFSPGYTGPYNPPIAWPSVERYLLDRKVRYDDAALVNRIVSIYDGGIRFTDVVLGQLLAKLRSLNLMDNTVIVVTSDHGEEFFDHLAFATHGTSLYEEMMHVPLVMHLPGQAAERISDPVGLIDIMPTLLEYLGVPEPEGLQGRSFLPLIRGKAMKERPVFMEDITGILRYGVRYKGIKRILSPDIEENDMFKLLQSYREEFGLNRFPGILQEQEVYDLRTDPGERTNLLHGNGEDKAEYLRPELESWIQYLYKTRRDTQEGAEIDPEHLQKLRELGYISDEQ